MDSPVMKGRNWEVDYEFVDCLQELKKYRNLQYDADFEDNTKDYKFYKAKADYYQSKVDFGIELEPKF